MKGRVTATVQATITITCDCVWGPECTVAQVKKQAIDDAQHLLHRLKTELPSDLRQRVAFSGMKLGQVSITERDD